MCIRDSHRAMYFRERSAKANKPPYSGFETIVDISTGIVRNLLDPCYWMFDNALNNNKDGITPVSYTHLLINTDQVLDENERLLDNQDLAFLLKVSFRTLQRYRLKGKLPYFTIGHKTYYRASDIRAFVRERAD